MNIKNILSIIRPHQWIKNVFVMVPLFFGGSLLDTTDIIASLIAVLAFSFIASSIYCLNAVLSHAVLSARVCPAADPMPIKVVVNANATRKRDICFIRLRVSF